METKDLHVECPCCQSRLEVDVRTGKILRWGRKTESDPSGKPIVGESHWGGATERVSKRLGTAADKFDQSLQRERTRSRDLDDLFRKASEKLDPRDDD
jgi:hypothetical protein